MLFFAGFGWATIELGEMKAMYRKVVFGRKPFFILLKTLTEPEKNHTILEDHMVFNFCARVSMSM